MIKIEAYIHRFKLEPVQDALRSLKVENVLFSQVRGHGTGCQSTYRGVPYRADVCRLKLEMLVSSLQTEEVVQALLAASRTVSEKDDGTIVTSEVADAIQIHNGEQVRPMLR